MLGLKSDSTTLLPPTDGCHLGVLLGVQLACAAIFKSQPDAKLVHLIKPEL